MHDRTSLCLHGSVSSKDKEIVEIWAWPDSDLAGDKLFSSKSTSGRFLELVGCNERGMPLHWSTHKQGGTSNSTPEAESVSLSDCMKADALAVQGLFSILLKRPVVLRVLEDNTTCIRNTERGYSQNFRYLQRTQRTSLGFLHEVFHELEDAEDVGPVILQYSPTKVHRGDFFTKDSLTSEDFAQALRFLRIHPSFDDFERGERNYRAQNPQSRAAAMAAMLPPEAGPEGPADNII